MRPGALSDPIVKALHVYFIAFSDGEPASTSPENALALNELAQEVRLAARRDQLETAPRLGFPALSIVDKFEAGLDQFFIGTQGQAVHEGLDIGINRVAFGDDADFIGKQVKDAHDLE